MGLYWTRHHDGIVRKNRLDLNAMENASGREDCERARKRANQELFRRGLLYAGCSDIPQMTRHPYIYGIRQSACDTETGFISETCA
jgi:hypothetical protein